MITKKQLASFALVALILSPTLSWASRGRVGNGGNAVVCRNENKQIVRSEFLDLYEGEVIRKITSDPSLLNLTRSETLSRVNDKLAAIDPEASISAGNMALVFERDIAAMEADPQYVSQFTLFVSDALAKIDDSEEIFVPENCFIEQLVYQKTAKHAEDRLLNIQKEIWSSMSPLHQAATLLHEALLLRAVEKFNVPNSSGVRYLVSKFFSTHVYDRYDYVMTNLKEGFWPRMIQSEKDQPSSYPWSEVVLSPTKPLVTLAQILGGDMKSAFQRTLGTRCSIQVSHTHLVLLKAKRKLVSGAIHQETWDQAARFLEQGQCD